VALTLTAGPLLLPTIIGVVAAWRLPRAVRPALFAVATAFALLFFVSLESASVWIGWRAGQVFLVTAPALAAAGLQALWDSQRWRRSGITLVALLLLVGLPTTLIDLFNAQDVENQAVGPGFRWTVAITREQREALAWVRATTRRNAVVQMEPTVRGRETWTLIPSFAERRMSAGLPISLLASDEYETRSLIVRTLYETPDPELAWSIALDLGIDYVYVDRVEREHFPEADAKFERRRDLFAPVFANPEVRIYWVQPSRRLLSSGPASPASPSPIN
jgi:hypothetical protein